ncbi:TPA: phage tail protein [Escherichia coli]
MMPVSRNLCIFLNVGLGELSAAGVSGGAASASGYITIPMIINGARRVLYIQWGGFTGTTDSSGSNGIYETSNITVTWPVAFPNAVFQVITGGSSDVSGVGQQEMAWSLGKTKTNGIFGFQCRTPNASMTGSYLVIGY